MTTTTTRPSPDNPSDQAEPTYDELVLTATKAAALVLGAKVVSVFILAELYGTSVSIDYWFGFLPYFSLLAEPSTFASIVTFSTLAMAAAALALAVWTIFRPGEHRLQLVLGRTVAGIIALQTFGLELYRHWRGADTVEWPWAWLTIVAGVAGITVLAACLWNDRVTPVSPKGTT